MIIDISKPREKWFQQPTVGEKMARKQLRPRDYPTDAEVVEAEMNLNENETLVIPHTYSILPPILRTKSMVMPNPPANKFKRYGRTVRLDVPLSRQDALKEKFNPQHQMRIKFFQVQIDDYIRGYGWIGASKTRGIHKLVPLTAAIDGYAMYVVFEESDIFQRAGLPSERMRMRDYGKFCMVWVPSRSRRMEQRVRYDMLPIVGSEGAIFYADWTEAIAESTSEYKSFREIGYRYREKI